jgi:hypothetical protein
MTEMQLVDRVEKRRFVGREFLLWLWFESEVFEATLSTAAHGSFGMWIERQLVLSAGAEGTRIKGSYPGGNREAKEALLLGKLPETATFRITWGDRDLAFTLKAERLALSGLKLPTVLGAEPEEESALEPRRKKKAPRRGTVAQEVEREADERHESFYERMMLTREVEELVEALYRDFLSLRLSGAWEDLVMPAQRRWAAASGQVDADAYRKSRQKILARPARSKR